MVKILDKHRVDLLSGLNVYYKKAGSKNAQWKNLKKNEIELVKKFSEILVEKFHLKSSNQLY